MRAHILFALLLLLGLSAPLLLKSSPEAPIGETNASGQQAQNLPAKTDAKISNVPEVKGTAPADYKAGSQQVASKIEHVTVFSDRAEIKRMAPATIKAGFKWHVFRGLPGEVDKSRVQARLVGETTGRIEQVLIEEVHSAQGLPAEVSEKLKNLRELYAELLDIEQTEMRRKAYLKFLQSLEFQAPFTKQSEANAYMSFSARVENLREALNLLGQSIVEAEGQLEKTRQLREKITEKISLLENQLQDVRTRRSQGWRTDVYVLLYSPGATTADLQLTYLVPNAKWYPVYDLRSDLDRQANAAAIKLAVSGLVEQHTGEDWEDVTLTLSSQDLAPLYLPVLNRWLLSENREEAPDDSHRSARLVSDQSQFTDALSSRQRQESGMLGSGGVLPPGSAAAPQMMAAKDNASKEYAEDREETSEYEGADLKNKYAQFAQRYGQIPQGPLANQNSPDDDAMIKEAARRVPKVASRTSRFARDSSGSPVPYTHQERKVLDEPPMAGQFLTLDPLERLYDKLKFSMELEQKSEDGETRLHTAESGQQYEGRASYDDRRLPAAVAAGRVIEYTSPFKVTIKNDAPAQKIALTSQPLKATLSYFAIPKFDRRIFLRAKTQNASLSPILAGEAQIYMNGDLVSKTRIPTIGEDGHFDVDLGIDPSVETKRVVKKTSQSTGLISKDHSTEVSVRIEVANHHKFPVEVELKDHMPLSNSKEIKVEMVKGAPEAQRSNLGIITWKANVPAQKVRAFSFVYKVTHPENYLVSEFN